MEGVGLLLVSGGGGGADGAGGRGDARMLAKIELTIAPEGRTVMIMSCMYSKNVSIFCCIKCFILLRSRT